MPFTDLIGNKKPLETLQWGLTKDRLHHAYLFLGPEGVGKKTLALSLSKALHCLERVHDFCDRCVNCVRIRKGNHPDVRVVEPSTSKKEIGIQQIRELEKDLSLRAFSGRKKIAIIDPAPQLNPAAQNALLKTLEEPPESSLLILLSTTTGGLLPTLLSRCLRLTFAPIPIPVVAGFLVSQKGIKQKEAELLAAMAMGNLGMALSPETQALVERRRLWAERISSLGHGNYRGGLVLAEELADSREEAFEFLQWLAGWYRDILVYCATGACEGICNIDLEEDIKNQAKFYNLERILSLLGGAVKARARIQRNVNRRMALEKHFIEVVRTG